MEAADYRREIHDTFSGGTGDLDANVHRALEIGSAYLDLPIGFLTKIDEGTQTIVEAVGEHELIQSGKNCPLEEAYCQRTVEMDNALAIQHIGRSSEIPQTAYDIFGLGAYIGVRIEVNDDVYGTVCFADGTERDEPFSDAEQSFVELLATLIGQALEHREYRRDLEERNERLEAERDRIEAIATNSFDVLYRLDTEGTFTYVSPSVERMVGYDADELEGTSFTEYLTEESTRDALDAHEAILDGETVQQLEVSFVDSEGERVILELNSSPIETDGSIVGAQGVGRDVTERREREAELRIKNRAIDDADVGISIADAQSPRTPLVYINEGFERITGYASTDVVGKNCRFLQGPATDEASIEALRSAVETDTATTVELVNYRADGSPFWNQVRLSPIETDGAVTQFLGFQDDITERKRTEQLVRLLNRVLRHNLRNDMNAILGYADLIETGDGSNIAEYSGQIQRTAQNLSALSDAANDLERVAYEQRDPKRIDAEDLLESVASVQRDRCPAATIDVTINCVRDICSGGELEDALTELVINGIEHSESPEPWVALRADGGEDWVEITVEDDGPGISEMETAIVDEGRETPLDHGSGLGLWRVNWIVTRYGGSFKIEAVEDGHGSIATIRLPSIGEDATVEETARRPTVLFR
mgnify:CR=1 FL=1